MKKLFTFLSILLLSGIFTANAQIFWTENFESGSTAGLTVDTYTGPNGPWTLTVNDDMGYTPEATDPNIWYVSCAENGYTAGNCSTGCVPVGTTASTGATLHIGSNPAVFGDIGAAYDNGGSCGSTFSTTFSSIFSICVTTNRRAESPTINCTGKSNILMTFNYIMNGQAGVDFGYVWYFDGSMWSVLANPPITFVCPSTQGQWTAYSVTLPASANNNPNVKIGFAWVNNDDADGTDPSIAVDSVSLATVAPVSSFSVSSSVVCEDSCVTFTSTSTGSVSSITWAMPGVTITSPHTNPVSVCFPSYGSYFMYLYASGGGIIDTSFQEITVNPAPQPTIIHTTGHILSVSGSYTGYQWGSGLTLTPIAGATTSTYVYSVTGVYGVAVDSGGCWGWDTISVSTVAISSANELANKFWLSASGDDIALHAEQMLKGNIMVNIFDATGKEIYDEVWPAGTDVKQVNVGAAPPGIYLVKLSSQNTSEVLRWVRQ